MFWPHYTFAVLTLISLTSNVVTSVRNRELSSSTATACVLFYAASSALTVYILHVGGFW